MMLATTYEATVVARDQRVRGLKLESKVEMEQWRAHPLVSHIARRDGLWGAARNQAVFHFTGADMAKWMQQPYPEWETLVATNPSFGNAYFSLADTVVSLHGDRSDVPDQTMIDEFVLQWPQTKGFQKLRDYDTQEAQIYFACLSATHMAAVAFCHIVGNLFDEHMKTMEVRTGKHMPNDRVTLDQLPPPPDQDG